MVHTCSVYGCLSTTKYNKDLRFHRFPSDARCQLWIDACQRPDLKDKNVEKLYNMYVCSLHFAKWMYMKKKLKSAAIPVLNLPFASINPMGTQTEASKIDSLTDLHSTDVESQIKGFTVGVSVTASTGAQTLQTVNLLTDHTLRESELRKELESCAKKLKLMEDAQMDVTRQQFLQGCDKFLSSNLSKIVKTQLPSDGLICNACYVLLNQCSEEGTHSRVLGYPMVCIGCGCSVMGRRYPVRYHKLEENSPLIDIFFSWNTHNQNQDSSSSGNVIKVFCPKCNTEVSHTAVGIQEDQTKILIAKVYHYLEQEYEELKTIYGDLDLTPLSKFRQRTALAIGVSETTVLQILKEEEERNADKRQEPPQTRRRARKRSRHTDSSSEEDNSDDNLDDGGQSSFDQLAQNEPEIETLVVKLEPPEHYKEQPRSDPLSAEVKAQPPGDDVNNADENEPAGTRRRARKIPRSDVTPTRQHTQDESSCTAAVSRVRLVEELDESQNEPEVEMLVVKLEPPEHYKEQPPSDPLSAEVKAEPPEDDVNNADETLALSKTAGTKPRARKIPRSDVTPTQQHTQGESSTTAAASSARLAEGLHESGLLGEREVKVENVEMEEGFS